MGRSSGTEKDEATCGPDGKLKMTAIGQQLSLPWQSAQRSSLFGFGYSLPGWVSGLTPRVMRHKR